MKIWRLHSKHEMRYRKGHPWVFSNELQESPKGVGVGEVVTLALSSGEPISIGVANPHSLICYRELSRTPSEDPFQERAIAEKMGRILAQRQKFFSVKESFRVLFAESDGFPGMILDRFVTENANKQVFVLQLQSVASETIWLKAGEFIRKCIFPEMDSTWVIRRDSNSRKKEGIEIQSPEVMGTLSEQQLSSLTVNVDSNLVTANFWSGQKTGLFLDQSLNRRLAQNWLGNLPAAGATPDGASGSGMNRPPFRILDLFCYVGQWGVSLANQARTKGHQVQVVFADASNDALAFASQNASRYKIEHLAKKCDLLENFNFLETSELFDAVVCDPPALAKSRKDISAGKQAYTGLNTRAMKLVKQGGLYITCSCSQLISDSDFEECLQKSESRSGAKFQWVMQGAQSPDHPVLFNFPEGRYLKAWYGIRIS